MSESRAPDADGTPDVLDVDDPVSTGTGGLITGLSGSGDGCGFVSSVRYAAGC